MGSPRGPERHFLLEEGSIFSHLLPFPFSSSSLPLQHHRIWTWTCYRPGWIFFKEQHCHSSLSSAPGSSRLAGRRRSHFQETPVVSQYLIIQVHRLVNTKHLSTKSAALFRVLLHTCISDLRLPELADIALLSFISSICCRSSSRQASLIDNYLHFPSTSATRFAPPFR